MVRVVENTAGKTRDLPIASRLKQILSFAASVAGIDEVRVESGGQCAIGTCSKRVGSTRHDLGNAADLDLKKMVVFLNLLIQMICLYLRHLLKLRQVLVLLESVEMLVIWGQQEFMLALGAVLLGEEMLAEERLPVG